jgi:hypothetical protein
MGNFSKPPSDVLQANLKKNYVGVYIEQGVPVLDRDLNLLQDIISTTVRNLISRFIGDGVAIGSSGFAIQAIPATNDFRIAAGSLLVNGIEVINGADINYSGQAGVPPLTTPVTNRLDTVYLDISMTEVTGAQDPELLNSGDVGLQTSVRQRVAWVVRVVENSVGLPTPAPGHSHFLLARLVRSGGVGAITAFTIVDLRRPILSLAEGLRLLGAPAFGNVNPFTPTSGGVGATITLNGRNFNVGQLTVTFHNNTGSATATITNATATTATVTVPSGVTGACRILIANQFGSDTPSSFPPFNALLS